MAILIAGRRATYRGWVWMLAAVAFFATPALAQRLPGEYDLKAAFIYRIASFVEWPRRLPADAPLRLCVLGGNPFGPALDYLRGRKVDGHTFETRLVSSSDNLNECHLLFVSPAGERYLDRLVALSREAGILTLSDTDGFAQRGVMLNFYVDRDSVRFEVNLGAARAGGVRISSKLLSLARIVESGGGN